MAAQSPAITTKSPLDLARTALQVAQQSLPAYSNQFSRKDYVQPQLFAILVLREFFKTDYRGVTQMLKDFAELRTALGLKKVPHYTTLQKASARFQKKAGALPNYSPPS